MIQRDDVLPVADPRVSLPGYIPQSHKGIVNAHYITGPTIFIDGGLYADFREPWSSPRRYFRQTLVTHENGVRRAAHGVNWNTELGVVEVREVVGRRAADDQPDLA
jgi:hypothetical protein